jgi:hypothetical protein
MSSWASDCCRSGSDWPNWRRDFLAHGASPAAALEFEREVERVVREIGREVLASAYNRLEPEAAPEQPPYVQYEAGQYRRLNEKTANREVATLFGKITLLRRGYRYVQRDVPERTIFPLEMQLGLVAGATPALACEAARAMAEAGATQQTVLARLHARHGVQWGVKKLRAVTSQVAEAMEPHRRQEQARQVVQWLRQAHGSPGKNRPVLAVGRDGITLADREQRDKYEVATTATITVYGRGKPGHLGPRLGTVYLAHTPESGQGQMTDELTALLEEILRLWEGPLPQLLYLTDAGDQETKYFLRTLKKMKHPRTGEPLGWQWIVDYYHAALRLTALAEALFGDCPYAHAWARRMRKLLKKPNGPFRVLHAAAAQRAGRKLSAAREKEYQQAYQYLRTRTRHMQYHACRQRGLPIGSGVTEAACKTVFTQRLKLSGMRWSKPGAQVILTLRVILLSNLWEEVYKTTIYSYNPSYLRVPVPFQRPPRTQAA